MHVQRPDTLRPRALQDLSGNPLGEAGARALLPLLAPPPARARAQALTLLALRACGLTDRAGALLAAALAPGGAAGGRGGSPGGRAPGGAGPGRGPPSAEAGACAGLTELDLGGNALGAGAAAALGAALERNRVLRRLDLSGNRINVRSAQFCSRWCSVHRWRRCACRAHTLEESGSWAAAQRAGGRPVVCGRAQPLAETGTQTILCTRSSLCSLKHAACTAQLRVLRHSR
jgi:hypothetical protein